MSEFEPASQSPSGSGATELQEELQSLRTLIIAALVLLVVFSGSVNIYLLKQVSLVRNQIDVSKAVFTAEVQNFNTPKAIDYWNHLMAYARTHPDFAPIVNK